MDGQTDLRLRVAFLGSRGIPASYSGVETAVEGFATRLAAEGHEVTVYCRGGKGPSQYRGVRLVRLPVLHSKHLETFLHTLLSTLHAAFRLRPRPDVAVYATAGNAPIVLLARLLGLRTILNVDGADSRREKWGRLARRYLRFAERISVFAPNLCVTDSVAVAEEMSRRFGKRPAVVRYGVDPIAEPGTETLARLGLEAGKYVLFVGRLVPENNAHLLLEAWRQVERDAGMRLVIVGDAPYAREYQSRLRELAGPEVVFAGYLFGKGFRELASHAAVFVVPTEVGGTHPVLLEAMAAHRAVLASDHVPNLEVVGGTAVIFRLADGASGLAGTLSGLLADPQRRERLGNLAAGRVSEHYGWQAATAQFEEMCHATARPGSLDSLARLPRNTLENALARVAGMVAALIVVPYALSRLGTSRFAVWSLTGILAQHLGLLDLGASNAFAKRVADGHARGDRHAMSRTLSTGLAIYVLLLLLVVPACWAGRAAFMSVFRVPAHLQGEAAAALLSGVASFFLNGVGGVYAAGLVGRQRLDVTSRISIRLMVPQTVATLMALHLGGGLYALAAIAVLGALINPCLNGLALRRVFPDVRIRARSVSSGELGALVGFGGKLQLSVLAELAMTYADRIIVARFLGLGVLAGYEVAARVVKALRDLTLLLIAGVMPAAADLRGRGEEEALRRLFDRATRLLVGVAAGAFALLAILAPEAIRAWVGGALGAHGAQAASLVRILALGAALNAATGTFAVFSQGLNQPGLLARVGVLIAAVNVPLSVFLVGRFGIAGAAWGPTVALVAGAALFLGLFRRAFGYPRGIEMSRIWASGLAGGLAGAAAGFAAGVVAPAGRIGAGLAALVGGGLFGVFFPLALWAAGRLRKADALLYSWGISEGAGAQEGGRYGQSSGASRAADRAYAASEE
ncbi:MAG: glycosyltransferase [Actinomycetota bacterium]